MTDAFNPPGACGPVPHVTHMDGVASPSVGTGLTLAKTLSFPGGCLGPNGMLEIDLQLSFTSSGGTKETQLHLVGTGGDMQFWQGTNSSTGSERLIAAFRNQNNQAVQVAHPQASGGTGNVSGVPIRGAIDTSQDFQVKIYVAAYTGGDSAVVEHVCARVTPGA